MAKVTITSFIEKYSERIKDILGGREIRTDSLQNYKEDLQVLRKAFIDKKGVDKELSKAISRFDVYVTGKDKKRRETLIAQSLPVTKSKSFDEKFQASVAESDSIDIGIEDAEKLLKNYIKSAKNDIKPVLESLAKDSFEYELLVQSIEAWNLEFAVESHLKVEELSDEDKSKIREEMQNRVLEEYKAKGKIPQNVRVIENGKKRAFEDLLTRNIEKSKEEKMAENVSGIVLSKEDEKKLKQIFKDNRIPTKILNGSVEERLEAVAKYLENDPIKLGIVFGDISREIRELKDIADEIGGFKEAEKAEAERAASKNEPKVAPQPEAGNEPEVEPQPEAGNEPEVEPQPEVGTEPEVEPQPEAGTEPKVEPQPEVGTEPEVEPQPEAGTEPKVDTSTPNKSNTIPDLINEYENINRQVSNMYVNLTSIIEDYNRQFCANQELTGDVEKDIQIVFKVLKNKANSKELDYAMVEGFVKEVNEAIDGVNDLRKKVAENYIKITKQGIILLRELDKKIKDLEKDIEEKDFEIAELDKQIEEKKAELEKCRANKDDKGATELEKEIAELEKQKGELSSELDKLRKELEKQKTEFEKAKEDYLDKADKVRENLLTYGITINFKERELDSQEEEKVVTQNEPQANTVAQPVQPQANTVAQPVQPQANTVAQPVQPQANTVAQPVQPQANTVAQPVQPQANAVVDQVEPQTAAPQQEQVVEPQAETPQANLPIANLSPREKLDQDFNFIINAFSKKPIIEAIDSNIAYDEIIEKFESIKNSRLTLTRTQRKQLNEIFKNGREEMLANMPHSLDGIDENVIKNIVNSKDEYGNIQDNYSKIKNELTAGEGSTLLALKGISLEEMDEDAKAALQAAVGNIELAFKNNKFENQEQVDAINSVVLNPLKFACADRYAAIIGRSKIQKLFNMGKKALDQGMDKFKSSIQGIARKTKEIIASQISTDEPQKDEPVIAVNEQQKSERQGIDAFNIGLKPEEQNVSKSEPTDSSKGFRDGLSSMTNSNNNIDIDSSINATTDGMKKIDQEPKVNTPKGYRGTLSDMINSDFTLDIDSNLSSQTDTMKKISTNDRSQNRKNGKADRSGNSR